MPKIEDFCRWHRSPLGDMLAGAVSDRIGRKPVTIVMSLLLSLAFALFYNRRGTVLIALGLALFFMSMGAVMVLHTVFSAEFFPAGLRSTAAGVREAVIKWVPVLTPISPLILLIVPETARRELEEISPDPAGAASPVK
jgi:MFS family permease